MTNTFTISSLKSIKWNFYAPAYILTNNVPVRTIIEKSEVFSLQNRKCYLKFSFGYCRIYDKTYTPSHLRFVSDEELPSPLISTLRVIIIGVEEATEETKVSIKGGEDQIIWDSRSHFLGNSKLSFEIIIHNDTSKVDKSSQTYQDASFLMDSLSNDFSKLLDEGPNHDIEFACGKETIQAHKNILCTRSSVFASMLQSDMVEGKTGRVNIQDVDVIVFKQFLRCLYTGRLPELTDTLAFQLYECADKYCENAIKKLCAQFLTDNLSSENACDMLILADTHNDEDFKKNVIEYVIKEKILYAGQKWTDFCIENSALAVEVYSLFCEQFRQQ